MDLGAVGWRPACKAISRTLAENSLKLIALKGLVESNTDPASEKDSELEVLLQAMDDLL